MMPFLRDAHGDRSTASMTIAVSPSTTIQVALGQAFVRLICKAPESEIESAFQIWLGGFPHMT